MTIKTETLYTDQWNVRISDPGEEGAKSHFFEKITITLLAHIDGENIHYEFTRKIEDQIKVHRNFTKLDELFRFLGNHLDPVSLGLLGVKIGQLGVKV